MELCDLLREDLKPALCSSRVLTVEQQVLISLKLLASGSFQSSAKDNINVAQSTISCTLSRFMDSLLCKKKEFIYMPDSVYAEEIKLQLSLCVFVLEVMSEEKDPSICLRCDSTAFTRAFISASDHLGALFLTTFNFSIFCFLNGTKTKSKSKQRNSKIMFFFPRPRAACPKYRRIHDAFCFFLNFLTQTLTFASNLKRRLREILMISKHPRS